MCNIKEQLKTRFELIINTLYNQETKDLVRQKCYFAGGAIRDLSRQLTPKDYDLYFIDDVSIAKFKELSANEFSLRVTKIGNYNQKDTQAQFITLLSGLPDSVTKRFDFTINNGYYIPALDVLQKGDMSNLLIPGENIESPMNSLVRLKKFQDKGFTIDENTLINLGVQLTNMDPIKTDADLEKALRGMSTYITLNRDLVPIFNDDGIPF